MYHLHKWVNKYTERKEKTIMKKILLVLTVIFTILTFIGAGYVLASKGTVNAGYAVIPYIWTVICLSGYRWYKRKK